MTHDQYRTRLSILTYKTYRKVRARKLPTAVYNSIYILFYEEGRRPTGRPD